MNKAQIYEEIFKQHEKTRDENKRILEARKNKIYAQYPRIKEIDNEINMLGLQISRSVLKSETEEEKNKYIQEIQNKNKRLIREKRNILINSGYGEEYLEPIYKCEKCKDTGIVGNKNCVCVSQMFIDAVYEKSNMKNIVKEQNFESFDLSYYSEEIDKNEGISPYENMKINFAVCREFCKNFGSEFRNLIFYGKPGLGKTFLCSAIAKEIMDKGEDVIYVSAENLFEIVKRNNNYKEEENFDDFFSSLSEASLLIIDDLGTESPTVVTISALFGILNSRFINSRPVIISTNLSPAEMTGLYSERIVSRIYGEYTILKFIGDDIRILKRIK